MKGASIIEIIVIVAIIGLLASFSTLTYSTWRAQNELNVALSNSVDNFRRAQTLAEIAQNDSNWGVKFETGSITVFKGISYVDRDLTKDEKISLPLSIVFSGLTEVVFNKLSGYPQSTGSLTITRINDTKQITINSKGSLQY